MQILSGEEKEGVVLHNGAANCAAELVQLKWRNGLLKVIPGIQVGVAKELIGRSVDLVGAGAGRQLHKGARTTILSAVI